MKDKKREFDLYDFFMVERWMHTKLGLKGIDLQVFAIIYGFNQGGNGKFYGTCNYFSEFLGYTENELKECLERLQQIDLIKKEEVYYGDIEVPIYNVNFDIVNKYFQN